MPNIHWRELVGVVGDEGRRLGLARGLLHALLPDGSRAPGVAGLAGSLCEFAPHTMG